MKKEVNNTCYSCDEFCGNCPSCELRKEGEENCNCCGRPGKIGLFTVTKTGTPHSSECSELLEGMSIPCRFACTKAHSKFSENIFKLVEGNIID